MCEEQKILDAIDQAFVGKDKRLVQSIKRLAKVLLRVQISREDQTTMSRAIRESLNLS